MAAQQVHADGFDSELWDVDGDLWCVHRPRTWTAQAVDRRIVVFHAARADGLEPAIAALRRAGVAAGPTITSRR